MGRAMQVQPMQGSGSSPQPPRKRLGERLIEAGLITPLQLQAALREAKRRGRLLGETLVALGFIRDEDLANALAEEVQADAVDVLAEEPEKAALARVPYATARRLKALPLRLRDGKLEAAVADPFDIVVVDMLEKTAGMPVRVVGAPAADLEEAIDRSYAQHGTIEETIEEWMHGARDEDDEAPAIRLVYQIFWQAMRMRATDVHFEPEENIVRLRVRIDGALRKLAILPKDLFPALLTRIKILASMDITERRRPQDGRIRFRAGSRRLDLRVSTLPIVHGESVVVRLLESNPKALSLDQIEMASDHRTRFEQWIARPHGMILVTGPTGSGKTTTLYAALLHLDTKTRSVFTIEDPVEYEISGIRQIQVRPEQGLGFADGLRALLRQDPDVILVGEIRDAETAALAVRAALTGHLVFSTLHANDAPAAIPRLQEMGIPPYLLVSALQGVVAQRLVRRICDACRAPSPQSLRLWRHITSGVPEGTARRWLKWLVRARDAQQSQQPIFWQGKGCERCLGTGYRGRVAVHELLTITDGVREAMLREGGVRALREACRKEGMRTLWEDGLRCVGEGKTTLEELLRVVGLEAPR